jgi:hypothetical protein
MITHAYNSTFTTDNLHNTLHTPQALWLPEEVIADTCRSIKNKYCAQASNTFVCTGLLVYTVDGERQSIRTRRHNPDNRMFICDILGGNMTCLSTERVCSTQCCHNVIDTFPWDFHVISNLVTKLQSDQKKKLGRQSTLYPHTDRRIRGTANTRMWKCALYRVIKKSLCTWWLQHKKHAKIF